MKLRFGRTSSTSSSNDIAGKSKGISANKLNMSVEEAEKVYSNNDIMKVLLQNQANLSSITTDIATIKGDITGMKRDHTELNDKVNALTDRVRTLETETERLKTVETNVNLTMEAHCNSQITAVKTLYNSMAYNVIVRNLSEVLEGNEKWETTSKSIERAYYVLENIFNIERANDITLATAHRLPSTKAGPKPLIFKLAKLHDKKILWDHIKNIKKFNATMTEGHKVYVQMVQLPAKLAQDRASLQEDYDIAVANGSSPKWRYLKKSGQYCYVIDNMYYKPKVNYFIHKYVSEKKAV